MFQSPDQAHAATGDICQLFFRWSNGYPLNYGVSLQTNTTMDKMEHLTSPGSKWMTLHLSITVHTNDFSKLAGLSC